MYLFSVIVISSLLQSIFTLIWKYFLLYSMNYTEGSLISTYDAELCLWHNFHGLKHKPWRMENVHNFDNMLVQNTWSTEESQTEYRTRAGIYIAKEQKWGHLHRQYPYVFQVELYAIQQCVRNLSLNPQRNELISIFTDSQTAFENAVNN